MNPALPRLKQRLRDLHNLHQAGAVLDWDQQTFMPPRGVAARAETKTTITKLAHELFTAPETGELLTAAEADRRGTPESDLDAALLRTVRRDYDRATRLPTELVAEITRVTSLAQEEWAHARAQDDYAKFAPWLSQIVDLVRQAASCIGYKDRVYDALIDEYEPGTTAAQLDAVFAELKREQIPMVRAISDQAGKSDASSLHRTFDEEQQKRFAESILPECGFDFTRGRQDRSVHPFCTSFGKNDVRLTTRYDVNFLSPALFGSLHEMGHGLYEQGFSDAIEGSTLAGGASLGFHESQSRLWENLVGRSRPFWRHYYPRLREYFPGALDDVAEDAFYAAINHVSPSLIRVEADEVTYNLHIILRYEMENELLEGRLSVADAPEAWNAKMREYFGLTPPNNREGILQDVHWSIGILGYFPTYALGNLYSVQLFDQAQKDMPGLSESLEKADFKPLLEWLRENVHQHGRRFLPDELCRRITGQSLTAAPYLAYLRRKFGELYTL
jgi:carboxypeptidase Taq